MKPIAFSCEATLNLSPGEIAKQLLELERWPDFTGYAFLPGIKSAEFEVRTPAILGSRIRVVNADGSSHVEEIVEWQPECRLALRLEQFTAPLRYLATHFEELWEMTRIEDTTRVSRSLTMHATSYLTRPALWLISVFLKKAIARHLEQIGPGHVEHGAAGEGKSRSPLT